VNYRRLSILLVGPVPIVAASIGLTKWMKFPRAQAPSSNQVIVRGQDSPLAAEQPSAPPTLGAASPGGSDGFQIEQSCQAAAAELRMRLAADCAMIIRAPFVIAGDLSEQDLDAWHRRTIGPAARAMASAYFRTPPDEPITVLLFSGEQSYNRYAQHLFGDEGISVYGYYKPGRRTLVMNIATGGGTLVHELTHALIDFDFPKVPAWFNEGLASLHEQCRIRDDETGIEGLVNWRLDALQSAIRDEWLRSLQSLVGDNDFRGSQETLNYAQARYFCLYMQQQGVLTDFYRKFRDDQTSDPLGVASVAKVFPNQNWEELDADFRDWVRQLKREP
jgi:hypothetical protein